MEYGLKGLATFLNVHINTARAALRAEQVYKGWILSTLLLTKESIKTKATGSFLPLLDQQNKRIARQIHVYNATKTFRLALFSTASLFIAFSGLSGRDVKYLCMSLDKLWRDTYFLSYSQIDTADNSVIDQTHFIPVPASPTPPVRVFGYNPDLIEGNYREWTSMRACVAELENNRDFNTKSLSLRIHHNQRYHGYFVSLTPFKKS